MVRGKRPEGPRKYSKKIPLPDKPVRKTMIAYDYFECRHYLEIKYGYSERDFARRYDWTPDNLPTMDETVPYLDFWHWLCDHKVIHDGCYLTMTTEELAGIEEEWVRTIYSRYLCEFADDRGEARFWVNWWRKIS